MKLGIVGLPNVGKSTLFNSLTKAGAESANYPFCTIDPNVGVVTVPDERLNVLGEMYHTKKIIPAAIEFVDIAGLVKGASKGEGLGNQFLANIREVDAIVHRQLRQRLSVRPGQEARRRGQAVPGGLRHRGKLPVLGQKALHRPSGPLEFLCVGLPGASGKAHHRGQDPVAENA